MELYRLEDPEDDELLVMFQQPNDIYDYNRLYIRINDTAFHLTEDNVLPLMRALAKGLSLMRERSDA